MRLEYSKTLLPLMNPFRSFGIILALLNKARVKLAQGGEKPGITSLIIVPHRDLAFQMLHWIKAIVNASYPPPSDMNTLAQVVTREGSTTLATQIESLNSTPPHILLGTPQALMDIYNMAPAALQIESLATIAVDEVDYLIDIPSPHLRKAREATAWRNFRKHPSPTRQLLDAIMQARKPGSVPLVHLTTVHPLKRGAPSRLTNHADRPRGAAETQNLANSSVKPIQVIMTSATAHSNLRDYVLRDTRWIGGDEGNYLSVLGREVNQRHVHMAEVFQGARPEVVHHAFIVSRDGQLANIDGARWPPGEAAAEGVHGAFPEVPEQSDSDKPLNIEMREKMDSDMAPTQGSLLLHFMKISISEYCADNESRPLNALSPEMFEAIATFFALDVMRLALLVLPPNASVPSAVQDLQDLGINAESFDMRSGAAARFSRADQVAAEDANPMLLVATPTSTRGVDLPSLTHVFVLGVPDAGDADVFLHIAGRVDRFGRGGKVVTFLPEREVGYRDGMMKTKKNYAGLMQAFYRRLGIRPTRFDLSSLESALQ